MDCSASLIAHYTIIQHSLMQHWVIIVHQCFKELLLIKKVCIGVAILGMLLIMGNGISASGKDELFGILFGLVAAAFYAALMLLNSCFRILFCYLPSSAVWLISPPDARFPRESRTSAPINLKSFRFKNNNLYEKSQKKSCHIGSF